MTKARIWPWLVCWTTSVAWANEPEFQLLGHGDLSTEQSRLKPEAFGGLVPKGLSQPWLRQTGSGPRREVYAYLPYWAYTSTTPYVAARWDLITVLAWFSVGLDGNADVSARNGWGNATTRAIVSEAQAKGIKVTLTITNFESADIAKLVSPALRAKTINTCIGLMEEVAADGLNIDFEFVPSSSKQHFVTFMRDLKQAVVARRPNGHEGHVTLAGPAIDWNGAYDYDALLEQTDGIMVMAYGYHWQGSNPGPTAPLFSASGFSSRSVAWTIDDYLTYGKWENRSKLIIGLPWYGRKWKVANTNVPGVKLENGTSITYKQAEPLAQSAGKLWHEVMRAAYYHQTESNALYQVWYDDAASFRDKVAYVDEQDLGGVGIWALGYEGSDPALWNALDDVLGTSPSHEADVISPDSDTYPSDSEDDTEVTLSDTSSDLFDSEENDVSEVIDDIGPWPEEPLPNLPEHPDATEPAYPLRPIRSVSTSEQHHPGCQTSTISFDWLFVALALHRRRKHSKGPTD